MGIITEKIKQLVNRDNPTFQSVELGTELGKLEAGTPYIIEKAVTASAATAVPAFTAPFAMRIVDVIVRATATETNGTLQPLKGTDAMCTAITCEADGGITKWSAGATTAARLALATGDTVNLIATGTTAANVRGVVTFVCVRL